MTNTLTIRSHDELISISRWDLPRIEHGLFGLAGAARPLAWTFRIPPIRWPRGSTSSPTSTFTGTTQPPRPHRYGEDGTARVEVMAALGDALASEAGAPHEQIRTLLSGPDGDTFPNGNCGHWERDLPCSRTRQLVLSAYDLTCRGRYDLTCRPSR